jgi:hypothetical protein
MGLNKRTARISGLLWLLMSVTGLFSQMGFREKVFVTGDMVATADHILSNQFLFRMGFVCDLLMLIFYLLTGLALYRLFETVNKHQALLMGIFVILGTAIGMMNLLNEFASLQILSNEAYHKVLGEVGLQAQAMISYDLYEHGYVIADIFFSLWVLPLGVLIYKSGFIPRIFGIFFMIETVLGLLSVSLHFLYPNTSLETNLLWAAAIAEFSFMFWLLIRGINEAGVNRGGVISNHPRPV